MTPETDYLKPSFGVSSWCISKYKRFWDMITAAFGLILLSPILCAIGLAILITSGAPVIFRQRRVGRNKKEFELFKFRTMSNAGSGITTGLTQSGDSRVTSIGRLLRKCKLDELPQLVNVLRGEMTLVGPRPDLKRFWLAATEEDKQVLFLTPGLTGAASIAFCDEESMLAQVPAERLTTFYIEQVLPLKARLDKQYAINATFWTDFRLLLRTLLTPILNYRKGKKESYA